MEAGKNRVGSKRKRGRERKREQIKRERERESIGENWQFCWLRKVTIGKVT
jgi:hypothetical protein